MTAFVPRISVGLPVYNGEKYLAAAVDSLLSQTFGDFELILSDNASTDGTGDICRMYAAQDSRVRYMRNDVNIGVYRNCNKVVRCSRGEYFKLACADDLCHPDLLERCLAVLEADPTVVAAYARTRFIDEDGAWLDMRDPGWHLMSDSAIERMRYVIWSGHWVNLFFGLTRTRCLNRTRLFPLYAGSDCSLLGELCLMGRFCEVPDYLFSRRVHASASSQNRDLDWQSRFFKGRAGRIELPFWHVCVDHSRTILDSGLGASQKAACLVMLLNRMVSSKRTLLGELYFAGKYLYRTTLGTSG